MSLGKARFILTLGPVPAVPEAELVLALDPRRGLDAAESRHLLADLAVVGRDALPSEAEAEAAALACALHHRGGIRLQVPVPRLSQALGALGFSAGPDGDLARPLPPSPPGYGEEYIARWGEVDFLKNWKAASAQILKRLPGSVDPAKAVILDVGCLNGYIMESLRRAGVGQVLGCDFSPAVAFQAAVDSWHWPAMRIFDFCHNDYPDALADMVICMEVLEHVPASDTGAFLAQLKRVLKPGGVLVASISDDWLVDETHVNCRARHSWYGAFARAGLLPWGRQLIFPGFNNFVLRPAGPRLSRAAAALFEGYGALRGDAVAAKRPERKP